MKAALAARSGVALAASALVTALLGAGCARIRQRRRRAEAAIRDARPTRLQRGERMLVEASAPLFTVGAATTRVDRRARRDAAGARHRAPIASSPTSIDDVAASPAPSTITVTQGAQALTSDARTPFDVELSRAVLHRLANGWAARLPGPAWLWWALALAAAAALVAAPLPVMAGLIVVWERKISGYMGSRIGPNRVGPERLAAVARRRAQAADEGGPRPDRGRPAAVSRGAVPGVPRHVPDLHRAAVLALRHRRRPRRRHPVPAVGDVARGRVDHHGRLVVELEVVAARRHALGGADRQLRAAGVGGAADDRHARPARCRRSASSAAQGGAPWQWNLFHDPFTFVAFFIWFVSALAEGNRTPFDLPEAESELVSGYNTEYSGFRFSLFPLVEWVNIAVIGAVGTLLFLGGWRLPFVDAAHARRAPRGSTLCGFAVFVAQGPGDRLRRHLDPLDAAALPRRPDDERCAGSTSSRSRSSASSASSCGCGWCRPAARMSSPACCSPSFGVGFPAWFISRVRDNARRYQDLVLNDALGRGNP